jgi:hypothetical protein
MLVQWLDNNSIFNMLFGESLHSEVIKKSHFLLEFLYANDRVGETEISMMWEQAMNKHEAYKIAIFKALIFLASKAKVAEIRFMF